MENNDNIPYEQIQNYIIDKIKTITSASTLRIRLKQQYWLALLLPKLKKPLTLTGVYNYYTGETYDTLFSENGKVTRLQLNLTDDEEEYNANVNHYHGRDVDSIPQLAMQIPKIEVVYMRQIKYIEAFERILKANIDNLPYIDLLPKENAMLKSKISQKTITYYNKVTNKLTMIVKQNEEYNDYIATIFLRIGLLHFLNDIKIPEDIHSYMMEVFSNNDISIAQDIPQKLYKKYLKESLELYEKEKNERHFQEFTEFLLSLQTSALTEAKERKRDLESTVDQKLKDYSYYLKALEEQIELIHTLSLEDTTDKKEHINRFINVLTKNKYIKQTKILSNNILELDVVGEIINYDKAVAEQLLNKMQWIPSNINYNNQDTAKALIKALFTDLFIDNTIELKLYSKVHISFARNNITRPSDYTGRCLAEDAVVNPHIMHYNCFGDNAKIIQEYLAQKDLISTLSAIISACLSINLVDITVLTRWVRTDLLPSQRSNQDLKNKQVLKIIKTGEMISLHDYYMRKDENYEKNLYGQTVTYDPTVGF